MQQLRLLRWRRLPVWVVVLRLHMLLMVALRMIAETLDTTTARIHEEIGDGGGVETELCRDRRLHLLRWTLCLLENRL